MLTHRKLLKEVKGDGGGGRQMEGTYVCIFIDAKLLCYRHHVEHQELSAQPTRCISCLLRIYNPVDYWGKPWDSQETSFLLLYFQLQLTYSIILASDVHHSD